MGTQYDALKKEKIASEEASKLADERDYAIQHCPHLMDDMLDEIAVLRNWRKFLAVLLIIAVLAWMCYFARCFNQEFRMERVEEIESEYDFYHNGAAIVSENGSYYHRYGCEKFTADTYWIHNVEYAKWLGYKKCKYCWD